MKNITKFRKVAEENGFNFYYDRKLRLYALYKQEFGVCEYRQSAQYLTKIVIDSIVNIDILIDIYIKGKE